MSNRKIYIPLSHMIGMENRSVQGSFKRTGLALALGSVLLSAGIGGAYHVAREGQFEEFNRWSDLVTNQYPRAIRSDDDREFLRVDGLVNEAKREMNEYLRMDFHTVPKSQVIELKKKIDQYSLEKSVRLESKR